jgi:hypothetical protein
MSDPSDRRDELASAYLDGEATPAERAQVEADPRLMARVGELGAVRSALAALTEPPDAATRERALAAATAAAGAPPAATVTRINRDRPRRRVVAVGAAAAAVIAAIVVAVVATRSSDHSTTSSATVAPAARDLTPAAASTGPAPTLASGATTTAPAGGGTTASGASTASDSGRAPAPPYLGVADNDSELRALVAQERTAAVTSAAVPVAPGACTVPSASLLGSVTWEGTPAYVFVANGEATVVRASDCRPLATVPLT